MNPLYTETEFNSAKSRELLPISCIHCEKVFTKPKNYIQAIMKGNVTSRGDFCSPYCRIAHSDTRADVICSRCGKVSRKTLSELRKSKNSFCSKSCAANYNNAHRFKGNRISKLEMWLQEQLPILFPDLEFHFNRKDTINSELDIYIPALKLAFELNGIFHYEPIFGPEKLSQIQNNDSRKIQACIERGIEFCIIDVSSMKNFKPKGAQKFLDIVTNIIHSKSV